jgi:hypothetical protein
MLGCEGSMTDGQPQYICGHGAREPAPTSTIHSVIRNITKRSRSTSGRMRLTGSVRDM